MKSFVSVFLLLSASNHFHVDGAKRNVRAGYKATLLCSVSEQQIKTIDDKIYVAYSIQTISSKTAPLCKNTVKPQAPSFSYSISY